MIESDIGFIRVSKRVHVISDSQGSNMAHYLNNRSGDEFSVSGPVYPGVSATFILNAVCSLKELRSLGSSDTILLMIGTNDFPSNPGAEASARFLSQLYDFIPEISSIFIRKRRLQERGVI